MNRQTERWIEALLSGTISRKDFAQLQELLKSDPEAFRHYCRQSTMHGRLEGELGDLRRPNTELPDPQTGVPAPRIHQRRSTSKAVAIAAALLLLGLLIQLFYSSRKPEPVVNDPATNPAPSPPAGPPLLLPESPVARLTISDETEWDGDPLDEGDWLTPGRRTLIAGNAEITFDSGARVILQAPADLELVTGHHAKLHRGKCVSHIPNQAAGFQLSTPSSIFDDQDSSFFVAVDEEGTTEVRVLEGILEAGPRSHQDLVRTLRDNQALRLTDSTILDQSQIRHVSTQIESELPASERAIPSRYVHWSFDDAIPTNIPESGIHPGAPFPAKVELIPKAPPYASAEFIDGKFGEAVYLDGQGAVLATKFPGVAGSEARTVAFWVRVPPNVPLNNAYSMVSWGASPIQGGKWQIAWNKGVFEEANNTLVGAIRTEFAGGWVIGATDLRDGRWHHVVSVFLGGKSADVATHVRHYIDGRLEPVTSFKNKVIDTNVSAPDSLPTYIGQRMEEAPYVASFKGAIDELYIFPAALTPGQIENLYRENSPPAQFVVPALD